MESFHWKLKIVHILDPSAYAASSRKLWGTLCASSQNLAILASQRMLFTSETIWRPYWMKL